MYYNTQVQVTKKEKEEEKTKCKVQDQYESASQVRSIRMEQIGMENTLYDQTITTNEWMNERMNSYFYYLHWGGGEKIQWK